MKVEEEKNSSGEAAESPRPAHQSGKLWHRLSKVEQERVLASKITVGEFKRSYRQPSWCAYPDALEGMMGCWSLMTPKLIKKRSDCDECDECIGSDAFIREQKFIKRLVSIQRT